jgi:hypothetical protein
MDLVQVVLVAAVVVFVIAKRFAGTPLQAKSLLVPLALVVFGAVQLRGQQVSDRDVAFLGIEVVVGLVAGGLRGASIRIYTRDGHLWQRYGLATLGVWVAFIAFRIGMGAGEHLVGVHVSTTTSILLAFGASLLTESLVVGQRALRTGAPFAPKGSRRQSGVGSR